MTNRDLHQRIRHQYLQETGKSGPVTTMEVAEYAISKGWLKHPPPVDPLVRLADSLAKSWRQEIRHDEKTGHPYRANHAVTDTSRSGHGTLWGDIDNAPRDFMQKSFMQRREQIVGDCCQLSFDLDHFNAKNPNTAPIEIPLDFTEDVEERKHAPTEVAA